MLTQATSETLIGRARPECRKKNHGHSRNWLTYTIVGISIAVLACRKLPAGESSVVCFQGLPTLPDAPLVTDALGTSGSASCLAKSGGFRLCLTQDTLCSLKQGLDFGVFISRAGTTSC